MSKHLAVIVKKVCNICLHADVPENCDSLFCTIDKIKVKDDNVCYKFEVCKEVFSDTFFDIKEIKDYEL